MRSIRIGSGKLSLDMPVTTGSLIETGQTVDKVQGDSDRDYWMTAEEAKEYGLISEVVTDAGGIG